MSVDRVELTYDLKARSQEADALQAQYFHRVLAVERDVVKTDLAIHTTRLTEAQLGDDQFQMRYQRRVIRSLETEQRKVTAMLCAIENRFYVAKDQPGRALRPFTSTAVLSLTVVRMAPVALALQGTGLSRTTVLFMGWFGPRGLASIVLGLVYLERETELAGTSTIRLAVLATVLLSIFAHGLTAQPGINLYAKRIAALDETSPEHQALGDESPEPPPTGT